MAKRPVFVPRAEGKWIVVAVPVEFTWFPGMAKSQKQKSILSLHEEAMRTRGLDKILEISSKSEDPLGIALSAFNLLLDSPEGRTTTVETLFQGSKVFARGGPFVDLYEKTSREAKKDERLRTSGRLVNFRFGKEDWPLIPQTVFYDWLYVCAVHRDANLAGRLLEYDAFTDIEFNPKKSINCQAAAAALYKALSLRGLLHAACSSPREFRAIHAQYLQDAVPVQEPLL